VPIAPKRSLATTKQKPKLKLTKIKGVEHPALLDYIRKRAIDPVITLTHLKEAHVQSLDNEKHYFGLAFRNDSNGYEFRNPFFKGCLNKKAITTIKGNGNKAIVHIFEGFMDFLTYLTITEKAYPEEDIIILNSLSLQSQAVALIHAYKSVQYVPDMIMIRPG